MTAVNECGDCTLCCTLLPIKALGKPANMTCVHCDRGCSIHESKPFECHSFDCSWRQSGVDNDDLRPDKCGVVFEKTDKSTVFGNVSPGGVSNLARRQVQDFIKQGYTVRLSESI